PRDAAAIPLPSEETTPPVTKIYCVMRQVRCLVKRNPRKFGCVHTFRRWESRLAKTGRKLNWQQRFPSEISSLAAPSLPQSRRKPSNRQLQRAHRQRTAKEPYHVTRAVQHTPGTNASASGYARALRGDSAHRLAGSVPARTNRLADARHIPRHGPSGA